MPCNARRRWHERKVHIAPFLGHGVIFIKFQCFWDASGDHFCRVVGGMVFATYRISDTPDHAKTFYVTFLAMSRNRGFSHIHTTLGKPEKLDDAKFGKKYG